MFTDSENQQLYAFDAMAGTFTGALYANSTTPTIEVDPVTSAGTVINFTSALDLTWYGEVATFNGVNPIYTSNGNSGLWPLVEQPPSVTITPQSSAATSINLSPSTGPADTSVTVSGGGFIPNSQITITFNGNTVVTTTATAYGEIPLGTTFNIATSTPGFYTITATDTSSDSASAIFTLPPLETITFQISGIGSDAGASTILTIDSVNYTYSTLPASFIWPAESTHTITANTAAAGTGKQYVWASWNDSGAQSHIYTVPTANVTIIANYKIQWQQTFGNSGLAADATGNLASFSVTGGQYSGTSPISVSGGNVWVDNGATFSYTFQNPVTSSTTGKQYRFSSATGPASGYTVSGANTLTVTYVTQWLQTFSSSGLSADATGNLVTFTVTGGQYSGATSPIGLSGGTIWVDKNATVNYAFVTPVTSSVTGKQYSLNSVTGSTSPITVSGANTLTGNYGVQYQVTFSQTGITSSAGSNTVLKIGSANYAYNTTPSNLWVNSGTSFTWTSPVSVSSGPPFVLTGSSGSTPITSAGTYSATYTTETFGIDGTAYQSSGTHGQPTLTLTTTQPNDLIILIITQDSTSHTFTPSDTYGLTWNHRSTSVPLKEGNSEQVDEWWAIASSPLSSDTISLGESGKSAHDTVAIAIAISGANPTNPFDSHIGLPYTNTGTSTTTTPSVTGVTTSNANDLILGITGYTGTSTNITAATGYTLVTSQTYSTSQQWGAAEYKIVTATQSSATVTWGNNPGSNNWAMIVDAVQRAW